MMMMMMMMKMMMMMMMVTVTVAFCLCSSPILFRSQPPELDHVRNMICFRVVQDAGKAQDEYSSDAQRRRAAKQVAVEWKGTNAGAAPA